ncbi:hypothetical protein CALCODRAFT_309416 [Calocera cornea HHB12733]|uniref:Uncharacterized protein n=1 Tax=Calocera cornea HHB12733 TaxID=1353952 RepID=A0A165FHE3_9BASI|nr:hypothetical protein CALCODRAFT_309416 [Calocera cornea HHB12733]
MHLKCLDCSTSHAISMSDIIHIVANARWSGCKSFQQWHKPVLALCPTHEAQVTSQASPYQASCCCPASHLPVPAIYISGIACSGRRADEYSVAASSTGSHLCCHQPVNKGNMHCLCRSDTGSRVFCELDVFARELSDRGPSRLPPYPCAACQSCGRVRERQSYLRC